MIWQSGEMAIIYRHLVTKNAPNKYLQKRGKTINELTAFANTRT